MKDNIMILLQGVFQAKNKALNMEGWMCPNDNIKQYCPFVAPYCLIWWLWTIYNYLQDPLDTAAIHLSVLWPSAGHPTLWNRHNLGACSDIIGPETCISSAFIQSRVHNTSCLTLSRPGDLMSSHQTQEMIYQRFLFFPFPSILHY